MATLFGQLHQSPSPKPTTDLYRISFSITRKNDLSYKCVLNDQARLDLQWWKTCIDQVKGKSFFSVDPNVVIYSDASLTGWGAYSNDRTARGPWTLPEKSLHINELELIGAYNAIRSFAEKSNNISIRIFLDNNTAVCYVNKLGGTRSRNLTTIAKKIAAWCELRNNKIEAVYLPGKLNIIADRESRTLSDSSDWKLSSTIFYKICALWPADIDLFASASRTKI